MTKRILDFPAPTAGTPAHPLLVSYQEAARILGGDKPLSTRHIERMVGAGELRAVGRGRARRVVYASILAYVEKEAA